MNNITSRAPLLFVLIMVISIAVISLFAVAIQAGWEMMVLLVLCALALSTIALWFSRGVTATGLAIADKRLSANAEQHRHIEAVLKLGHNPKDYTPIERQITTPVQTAPQLPPAKGIQFDSADMNSNAINLLLYSCQLLGRDSKRIASNPECAAANIPGYNGRKWDAIINKHLKLSYDIATVPGPVDNGGGAFVPPEIGTVGAMYDRLVYVQHNEKLNDAVNALPEVGRDK